MAVRALTPATRRRLGEPLPHQQADRPRDPPKPPELSSPDHAAKRRHPVLARVSVGYPRVQGRFLTCYSPVRRFQPSEDGFDPRLACVRPAASVRPEPGSNSPLKNENTPKSITNSEERSRRAKGARPYTQLLVVLIGDIKNSQTFHLRKGSRPDEVHQLTLMRF